MTVQTDNIFSKEELTRLDQTRIPQHVAFINDGNRRWAKKHRITPEEGHKMGADKLMEIVQAGKEIGIRWMTFYLFSTENWKRPRVEIKALMYLLEKYLIEQRPRMIENGVHIHTIGDLSQFPKKVLNALEETIQATAHCRDVNVILSLNYGGRDEIRRAIQCILEDCDHRKIKKSDITEELISRYMDTAQWPDPDLLIRTSGEKRLSNYLLWQTSYSELYISDLLWPEFTPQHLMEAIIDFQQRERRLGGS